MNPLDDPTIDVALTPRELGILRNAIMALHTQLEQGSIAILPDALAALESVTEYVEDQILVHCA